MDWFGVVLIACVTALGGGSVRDVLLGHYPLTWVKHPEYLVLTSVAALLTIFIAPLMRRLRSLFLALDAVGLVAFTLIGCMTALEMGHGGDGNGVCARGNQLLCAAFCPRCGRGRLLSRHHLLLHPMAAVD